jgi:hypothetical protein
MKNIFFELGVLHNFIDLAGFPMILVKTQLITNKDENNSTAHDTHAKANDVNESH